MKVMRRVAQTNCAAKRDNKKVGECEDAEPRRKRKGSIQLPWRRG